jgi:hypothetical protein
LCRKDIEKETSHIIAGMNEQIIERSSQLTAKAVLAFETDLNESLKSQQQLFDEKIREELNNQLHKRNEEFETKARVATEEIELAHSNRLLQVSTSLRVLSESTTALEAKFASVNDTKFQSLGFLEQSAAIREFEASLETASSQLSSKPSSMVSAVTSIRKAFPNDAFVEAVLDSLQSAAAKNKELALYSDAALHTRFLVLRDEMRKVALAPPTESTMVGLFIGSILAKISAPPKTDKHSIVQGGNGVEECLSRVDFYLEQGQHVNALREMDRIGSSPHNSSPNMTSNKAGQYVRLLSEDWKQLMKIRIATELSLKALKGYVQVHHIAFSK